MEKVILKRSGISQTPSGMDELWRGERAEMLEGRPFLAYEQTQTIHTKHPCITRTMSVKLLHTYPPPLQIECWMVQHPVEVRRSQ